MKPNQPAISSKNCPQLSQEQTGNLLFLLDLILPAPGCPINDWRPDGA
jgi:hypothetical protein